MPVKVSFMEGPASYNERYLSAGIKGVIWAMKQIDPSTGGLPRSTSRKVDRAIGLYGSTAASVNFMSFTNTRIREKFLWLHR